MATIAVPCPASVLVELESGFVALHRLAEGAYGGEGVDVTLRSVTAGVSVELAAATVAVRSVHLVWNAELPTTAMVWSDSWERGYGDLGWQPVSAARVLPWAFAVHDAERTDCYGVQTQPGAMCWWQAEPERIRLCMDVRSGRRGVMLGRRRLKVATIVTQSSSLGEPAFGSICNFYRKLCPSPRNPAMPVYGFNDFYYAYSMSTQESIMRDSDRLAELAPAGQNRPFCIVDGGWQLLGQASGGPWDRGNRFFPDMPGLARKIKSNDQRPGVWFRPLTTQERLPESWLRSEATLDPSVPEALDYVEQQVRRFTQEWGYELVKHDFSTVDLFSRWGKDMQRDLIGDDKRTFADQSRTSAEIVIEFYRAIRRAAGDALVLGCNTIGHLSAGLVEISRTGDDTSGGSWEQTVKHGVNSLAFKMPQHNAFFAADADCIGILGIPWEKNRLWLDVLARSGTPLFVSAAPQATGPAEKQALREAFAMAAKPQAAGEPLDWFDSRTPAKWRFESGDVSYNW